MAESISTMTALPLGFAVILMLILLRTVVLLHSIRQGRERQARGIFDQRDATTQQSTLVILGSGGHTTEMLQLIRHLNPQHYQISLVIATTDTTSLRRVQAFPHKLPFDANKVQVHKIPRSREVGQSYLTSILTTLYSFGFAISLVAMQRPDLVLVNGPGTCLPIAISSFFFRVIGWKTNSRIVFVESFCRVTSLSLTGKLLYHVADLFCVCWEELQELFPRAQLLTTFVLPAFSVVCDTDGKKAK